MNNKDFELLNTKFKDAFYKNKTLSNLERYILSEVYVPISDFQNAVKIIREEEISFSSKKLMLLESYFCFTQLFSESQMFPILEIAFTTMTNEEKAIFYYLKALSFCLEKNEFRHEIIEALDNSISFNVPFVSNYLYRAELEEDRKLKKDFLAKGYDKIRTIFTENDCNTILDEDYFFDINNYIDSEIKSIDLTDVQVMYLFKDINTNKE